MSAFEAIILGLVQGLTEFLPISSSAHLRFVPALFGWEDPGAGFTAIIQLGTIAAVLIYFRQDLLKLAAAWLKGLRDPQARRSHDYKLAWYIIFGTVPIAIIGKLFSSQIENNLRSLYLISFTLIAFGFLLLFADRKGKQNRGIEKIGIRDGLIIGLAQAMALVPGVSRSGATMTAGLLLGLDRAAAARYSFLLSVPAIVLSGVYQLTKIGEGHSAGVVPTIIATVVSFVVGYAAIAWMIKWLGSHTVAIFTGYRLVIGLGLLLLLATGALSAT